MDTNDFGQRLRRLRQERGLSQAQLAADDLSASYVSLLEAGKRRPTEAILERLAGRLGCDVSQLSDGASSSDSESIELELRYAEIALHAGEAEEAARRFRAVAEAETSKPSARVHATARWGWARALEATGEMESAIGVLESLREEAETSPTGAPWLPVVIALCRCYREIGDLARAIDLGEHARRLLHELRLQGTDAEVELLSTLVAGYLERGDLARGRMLAAETIQRAEQLGTRRSRGAAYWNASVLSQELGQTAQALQLAERALALFAEGDDVRSLARLKTAYAWILLQQRPPQAEQAEPLLVSAMKDLIDEGSAVDLAYCETELARLQLILGRPEAALHHAGRSLEHLGANQRLEAARARLLLGRANAVLEDSEAALTAYQRAAEDLGAIGASRQAAASWRELAEVFSDMGREGEALDAYRRAADASGIPAPAVTLVPVASRS